MPGVEEGVPSADASARKAKDLQMQLDKANKMTVKWKQMALAEKNSKGNGRLEGQVADLKAQLEEAAARYTKMESEWSGAAEAGYDALDQLKLMGAELESARQSTEKYRQAAEEQAAKADRIGFQLSASGTKLGAPDDPSQSSAAMAELRAQLAKTQKALAETKLLGKAALEDSERKLEDSEKARLVAVKQVSSIEAELEAMHEDHAAKLAAEAHMVQQKHKELTRAKDQLAKAQTAAEVKQTTHQEALENVQRQASTDAEGFISDLDAQVIPRP
jgi:hypothetical protein